MEDDQLKRFEEFSVQAVLVASEFSVYLFRNLADLLVPATSYTDIKKKLLKVNWSPSELADAASPYVD